MANPFSSILSNSLKTTYDNAIQALIDFGEVPCRLYTATSATEDCPQCQKNNIGGAGPNPFLNSGQPGKYSNNNCVLCGGSGRRPKEVTSTVNLVVIFDNSKFIDAGGNVKYTSDMVQTVSEALETHTAILRANYIIFDTDIENYKNDRFERAGAPQTYKLGHKTFLITNWKRIA